MKYAPLKGLVCYNPFKKTPYVDVGKEGKESEISEVVDPWCVVECEGSYTRFSIL